MSRTLIDDTIAVGFIHNGLSPSTEYCYFATAFDESDNESLGSIINCATTDPAP